MSAAQIMLRVIPFLLVGSIGAFVILDRSIKTRQQKTTREVKIKGETKLIFYLYRFFSRTPFFKRYFAKLKKKIETQYPADEIAVRKKTTEFMASSALACVLLMLLIIITSRGDVFFVLAGVFMIYVMFTHFINILSDRMEGKLLQQLADFITDVRHYYSSTGSVEDAIYDTLDEIPYEIGLHVTRIYQIMNSTHTDEEVDKYTDIAPNNFIMTFVAICASIKEFGDKTLDSGQSLFLTNINYLKEEINVEMIKRKRNQFLFSGLVLLSLLPIFFIKPIEMWGVNNIPEMAEFYTGSGGTIAMAIIFALTLLTYNLIINLKDGHQSEVKEHKLLDWLIEHVPFINPALTSYINHNYTWSLRTDDSLKMVGDNIGIKGFLLKRVIYGIVAVFAVNVIIFTSEYRSRQNILSDFSESFSSSIVPNEEYRANMQAVAEDLTRTYKTLDRSAESRETLQQEAMDRGFTSAFASEIADEVMGRAEQYADVYYKWWYLIFSIVGFFGGYMTPMILLMYQLSIVKMDMEDEVVQFQTIVLILMHVDGIMVDTILEWMERFAFCFKQSISECIINMEYSAQNALLKMKNSESFPPFRRFVDNLLAVDEEDIETAFSEIEIDREYYKEKRRQDNEIIATQKSERGKMIAFIPLFATLGLYLIIPFGKFAFEMISQVGEAF